MNNVKISLSNVQGKLSRMEMKQVLGGLVLVPEDDEGQCSGKCSYLGSLSPTDWREGKCIINTAPMQTGCACEKPNNEGTVAGCIQQ